MIETVILAGLLATTGGIVLWLSHWVRRHIDIRYRVEKQ